MSDEKEDAKKQKYAVRPPRDLTSKFIKQQQQKEKDLREAEERKRREEEEARIAVRMSTHENLTYPHSISPPPPPHRNKRNLPKTSSMASGSTAGCWCWQGRGKWLRASSWSPQQGRPIHLSGSSTWALRPSGTTTTSGSTCRTALRVSRYPLPSGLSSHPHLSCAFLY